MNKELNEEDLGKMKDYCSFENMKKNDKANFSHLVSENKMTSDRKGVGLVRKGIIGDWRNYFTDEMRQKMDRLIWEKLEPLGLRFDDERGAWNTKAKM